MTKLSSSLTASLLTEDFAYILLCLAWRAAAFSAFNLLLVSSSLSFISQDCISMGVLFNSVPSLLFHFF